MISRCLEDQSADATCMSFDVAVAAIVKPDHVASINGAAMKTIALPSGRSLDLPQGLHMIEVNPCLWMNNSCASFHPGHEYITTQAIGCSKMCWAAACLWWLLVDLLGSRRLAVPVAPGLCQLYQHAQDSQGGIREAPGKQINCSGGFCLGKFDSPWTNKSHPKMIRKWGVHESDRGEPCAEESPA